jgi:predicted alpha/beta-fold hydrolase
MGISAGAALSAKYVGLFGKEGIIKAYGSISNPYNFARVSFNLENLFWGRILSRIITVGFKKGLNQHKRNPIYQEILQQQNIQNIDLENANTCWDLDSKFTYKLGSKELIKDFDNIFSYYYSKSCENSIKKIAIPSLFINTFEDPVCM